MKIEGVKGFKYIKKVNTFRVKNIPKTNYQLDKTIFTSIDSIQVNCFSLSSDYTQLRANTIECLVIVPKKIFKKSHTRFKIRRRIKAIIYLRLSKLKLEQKIISYSTVRINIRNKEALSLTYLEMDTIVNNKLEQFLTSTAI